MVLLLRLCSGQDAPQPLPGRLRGLGLTNTATFRLAAPQPGGVRATVPPPPGGPAEAARPGRRRCPLDSRLCALPPPVVWQHVPAGSLAGLGLGLRRPSPGSCESPGHSWSSQQPTRAPWLPLWRGGEGGSLRRAPPEGPSRAAGVGTPCPRVLLGAGASLWQRLCLRWAGVPVGTSVRSAGQHAAVPAEWP